MRLNIYIEFFRISYLSPFDLFFFTSSSSSFEISSRFFSKLYVPTPGFFDCFTSSSKYVTLFGYFIEFGFVGLASGHLFYYIYKLHAGIFFKIFKTL